MRQLLRKIYLVVPFLMVAAACEPEAELFSNIPEEVVSGESTDEVIDVLKKGAYGSIIGTWGGHNSLWSLREVASDEMAITQKGADWEDGQQWIRVHQHNYNPDEQSVNNGWVYCYGAIANINLLLIQYGSIEALAAELKVLRAVIYLWLLDSYGNVPLIVETDDDPNPPTASRADVFSFVEQQVLDNYALLPAGPTYATINQDVADALLAKLYLNAEVYTGTQRWADAETRASNIIDGGNYSLESNFFAAFATNNQNSTENIFVLPYDENTAGGFNLVQMTLHYGSQGTYDLQEQPWNGYSSLEEFYNSFDPTDDRIGSFIEGPQFNSDGSPVIDGSAEESDPDGPELNFTPFITELFPNALRQEGVRVGKFQFASGAGQSLSNDFPLFRLGEMYLIRAEARWRQNNSAGALDDANVIRARANADLYTTLDADELLAEWGREMFAEGWRRSNLIRFGRYNDAWWEKEASTADKNIFPIPTQQLDTNPNLVQNSGY